MKPKLPDPLETARKEAEALRLHRHDHLEARLQRTLADAPHIDRESLLQGLTDFHRKRMHRIPSTTAFPEAQPWIEQILAVDREVQRLAGLSEAEMAVYRSLTAFLTFRGFRHATRRPAAVEKCRVAYFPETDRGEMHIKNVDDPATYWDPTPLGTGPAPEWRDPPPRCLVWDGVGSGLHFDDEPPEIFPLPVPAMCHALCDDVPGAVEFLTRYVSFWGGQNIVLHDARKRSVAIEKCSHNFIDVFQPDATGRSWCSGMACRDAATPQGRYQADQRALYLRQFGLPADGPDAAFWAACNRTERMLGEFMRRPGTVRVDDVLRLFVTPYPEGLCKNGWRFHPDQAYVEYTLITHASVATADERTGFTWQRGPKPGLVWPDHPHTVTVRRG